MNKQFSKGKKSDFDSFQSDLIDRRSEEMKRRFQGLQIRRNHLESELHAVENCLMALDRQIKSNSAYRQLTIRS